MLWRDSELVSVQPVTHWYMDGCYSLNGNLPNYSMCSFANEFLTESGRAGSATLGGTIEDATIRCLISIFNVVPDSPKA